MRPAYETQESTISFGEEYMNLPGIHEIEADTHAAIINSNGGSLHYGKHKDRMSMFDPPVAPPAPTQPTSSATNTTVTTSSQHYYKETVEQVAAEYTNVQTSSAVASKVTSSTKKSRKIERMRRSKADRRSGSVSDTSNSSSETDNNRKYLLANGKGRSSGVKKSFTPNRSAMPVSTLGSDGSSITSDPPASSSLHGDSGNATWMSNHSSSSPGEPSYSSNSNLISFMPDGKNTSAKNHHFNTNNSHFVYANYGYVNNEELPVGKQYATVIPSKYIPKKQPQMGTQAQPRSTSLPRYATRRADMEPHRTRHNSGSTSHKDDSGITDDTSSLHSGRYASSIPQSSHATVYSNIPRDPIPSSPTYTPSWSQSKTVDRPRYKKNIQNKSPTYSTLPAPAKFNGGPVYSNSDSSHISRSSDVDNSDKPKKPYEFTDTHF